MGTTAFRRRVSPEDYRVLQELASAQTPDAARARIVLAVLGGAPPAALARQAGVPRTTVYSWVRRFAATGAAGLCHRSPHGYPIGPSRAGTVAEIACPEAPPPTGLGERGDVGRGKVGAVLDRASGPPPRVGDMEEVRRRAPGRTAAPVVAGGGAHVGVPRELLHRGDVRASVEKVAHVGAAQVVRGEVVHPGLGRALGKDGVDRLLGHPPPGQATPLVDGDEERPFPLAPHQ